MKAQVRKRTELENGEVSNEESIDSLDKQLAESKFTLAASESKFDDISRLVFHALLNIIRIIVINITQHPLPRTNLREIFRKLATLEADATRGNERAEVHIWQIKTLLMITMEILEVKTAEHKPYVETKP